GAGAAKPGAAGRSDAASGKKGVLCKPYSQTLWVHIQWCSSDSNTLYFQNAIKQKPYYFSIDTAFRNSYQSGGTNRLRQILVNVTIRVFQGERPMSVDTKLLGNHFDYAFFNAAHNVFQLLVGIIRLRRYANKPCNGSFFNPTANTSAHFTSIFAML
ncbi:MAG: hypothetical protein P8Y45_08910, partial [Exilibacterium sp.]